MTNAKRCPNVDEGPCISEYDAIEAWNHHVEGGGKD
jgi:hypothetical protein